MKPWRELLAIDPPMPEPAVHTFDFPNLAPGFYTFVLEVNAILTASVPVIKLKADPSIEQQQDKRFKTPVGIKVDIIVDTEDGFNKIGTALRTTEYTLYCISFYPSFFRNVLLLKFLNALFTFLGLPDHLKKYACLD